MLKPSTNLLNNMMITSKQNEQVKQLKKLQTKKGRQKVNKYLLEGPHLIDMAIQAKAPIQAIYFVANSYLSLYNDYPQEEISELVAEYLSETEHTQSVFAVIKMSESKKLAYNQLSSAVLILDGVQDPGNLGTIIRTADAFGYQDILLGKGTVDIYNSKVLRSMQGSHFNVNIHYVDLAVVIPQLQTNNYYLMATELNEDAESVRSVKFDSQQKFGVVLGNEGNGVSQNVLNLVDQSVYIPMQGNAESLNVGIAAAIVMYQFPAKN